MAITRLGFMGPWMAYLAFQPKTEAAAPERVSTAEVTSLGYDDPIRTTA